MKTQPLLAYYEVKTYLWNGNTFFSQESHLLFDHLAGRLAIVAMHGTVGGDDTMAGDFGSERVLAEGLSYGLCTATTDAMSELAVGDGFAARDVEEFEVDAALELGDIGGREDTLADRTIVGATVFLAVEGLLDFGDYLVLQWNFEGFETRLEILDERLLIELDAWLHDDQQTGNLTHERMLCSDTETVGNSWHGHGYVLHFGRSYLEATDVDELAVATGDVEVAIGIDLTDVGRDDLSRWLRIVEVAAHDHRTCDDDMALCIETDFSMHHGRTDTALPAHRWLMEREGTDDTRLGRSVGIIETRLWQEFSDLLHIAGGDRCGTGFDELDIIDQRLESLAMQLHEHADGRRDEEGGGARCRA